ncbi:MAG: hypothetical protein HYU69_16160 [Bacteroidetes bacterium]|nr:hypothetical protein [Bacteroidota bacterium]
MKQFFNTIMIFATASILFVSCSRESGISLTKRHYRSGYYVERNHSSHVGVEARETGKSSDKKVEVPVSISTLMPGQESSGKVIASENKAGITKAKNVKELVRSIRPSSIKSEDQAPIDNAITGGSVERKNMFFEKKEIMASGSAIGHSLVWIIIVVLLILWGLSLLSGAGGGGLLWLLLVIALVLLILRLLGIL